MADSHHEALIDQLEQEYIPLDSSLIRAIILDFNLSDARQLNELRDQLSALQASAVVEEAGAFDASGASNDLPRSSSVHSPSSDAEGNSITTGTSALTLESGSSSSPAEDSSRTWISYDELDSQQKVSILRDTFANLSAHDVEASLRRCNYDIDKATDLLLNRVFFDETFTDQGIEAPIRARGIDAFSEDNGHYAQRGRSKRNKKKYVNLDDELARSSSSPAHSSPVNKWNNANEDIAFIAKKTRMSNASIASLYHKNGASLSRTVTALIDEHLSTQTSKVDTQVAAYAADLVEDFPSIPLQHAAALVLLTKQSTADAHELAKAMTSTSSVTSNNTHLVPQYNPIKLPETSPSTPTASPAVSGALYAESSQSLFAARGAAFENASRYYRKGKSDKLMGGAAAYYSEIGRSYATALQSVAAAEADAKVASQSSSTHVDLHGVTVKEATRIACERAAIWWESLGENRIAGGGRSIGNGLRIVTGLGRHSEGGKAKLGPAVSRALLRDGWKVVVGSGELTVTGKMK